MKKRPPRLPATKTGGLAGRVKRRSLSEVMSYDNIDGLPAIL
jgi:hypothetical protein